MIRTSPHLNAFLTLVSAAALVAGCSRSPEPTYSVQGTVTYQGKPLDGGTVLFDQMAPGPSGQRYTARGRIDAGGRYSLSTFGDGDGAPAGRYRVAVAEAAPALAKETDVAPPPTIPTQYSSVESSGLEYEVKPQSNEINIELQ